MFFYAATQVIQRETPDEMVDTYRSMYMSSIIFRTPGPMPDLEKQVRRVLAQINPDLPVIDFFPFAQQVESNLDQQQMIAQLMTIFGVLALLIATVGLYGVTAYGVGRRTNEIGLRMALGADRRAVVSMVMRTVVLQSVAGLLLGVPLVLLSGRLLASKLFGVHTFDLAVFGMATLALAISALVAGFLPARRAAQIQPMQALRAE
jgi:ABC-type antimicrobial peptide transport system permease subunit